MGNLLKELDALPAEKRELLLKKLQQRKRAVQSQSPSSDLVGAIVPVPRDRPLPLSFSQQRLWFLDQFDPGTPAFNLVSNLRLSGNIDLPALRRTLDEIVRRHESLRTIFIERDGQPVQIVQPPSGAAFTFIDLHPSPAAEQAARVRSAIVAETQYAFDLTRGPLFRTTLIRLEPRTHLLCLNVHHIIFDGWSNGVLLHELTALYQAFRANQPSPLPTLAIQYADYAVWQRQLLQGAYLERQLAYWRGQLGDDHTLLHLSTDRPRPPIRTTRGASLPYQIDSEVASGVRHLAQCVGASPYIVFLAALKTLLYRYTHDTRMSIGTFIANRHRRATEPLIGFFVNTLVLRTDLSGGPTFRELLDRVKDVSVGAYEHQDLPFEKLLEELQPTRDMSRTPFFQVMLVLQNMPGGGGELPALAAEPFYLNDDGNTHSTHFDMTLWLSEQGDTFTGWMEYNVDLFDRNTIARMTAHLTNLLRSVIASVDQRIDAIDFLAPEEHAHLLATGGTQVHYAIERGAQALVEQWAERTPGAAAVVYQGEQVTYAELDRRAGRLAHTLRALGVGPEVRVGICVERSVDMIVGVLAVWKAGGAYVPLDPAYPAERLVYMIGDSRPRVILTHTAWLQTLPASSAEIICLDDRRAQVAAEHHGPPLSRARAGHLAYVVYTSGSTGLPKGVLVEQRALVNASHAWRDAYALRPGMRHLQMASFSFDVFAGDLARSLCSGGTLVICPREVLVDPPRLYRLIRDERIGCGEFVPVVIRELLHYLQATGQILEELERLVVGSDVWRMDEYRQLQASCGLGTQVVSSYGVSEATIDSTYFIERNRELPPDRTVPIGRPFSNTQIYILNRALQPVPAGVAGELCVGGAGLARGYLNRPDLTAERFIPNPFLKDEGSRMKDEGSRMKDEASDFILHPSDFRLYRTGDLCRYLPDGNIEFLGRVDHQVKIRGFRIELGEIEAVLGQHPLIQDAVAAIWRGEQQDAQLVAYIVLATEDRGLKIEDSQVGSNGKLSSILYPLSSDLRDFLKERLPVQMLPARVIALEALPLTPNGKIDRGALPSPEQRENLIKETFVQPATPAEQTLAAIWAEILQHERIGIHDDFFVLGGHSLLATQVISRLKVVFQVDVPLRTLFEKPTIAALAAELASRWSRTEAAIVPIVPAPRDRPLPLSFSQQRLWFLDQFEPGTPAFNLVSSIQLTGDLHLDALRQALDEIVRRHEVLRTVFAAQDGLPFQVILAPEGAALSVHDLQALPAADTEAQARRLILAETRHAFDLHRGPLFRAMLIRLAPHTHILGLNIHHIVFDGWSNGILLQELVALYRSFRASQPAPLPELEIQYADYAVWQRQLLQGAYLEQQLAYWRRQLGDATAPLNLPTDRPRPPIRTSAGALVPCNIDRGLTVGLRQLANSAGVSLYIVLVAALKTLLHRYTHDPRISLGTYIANRHHPAVEPLIGFFVNTLVLRTDLSGEPTFRELVGRVREVALGAYEHQDLPFEKLIEELQPTRDMSHTPFFQVMLVLQNTPLRADDLPEVTVEILDLHDGVHAHFDLTLWLSEDDQEIIGSLEYNTDLFDGATALRMTGHLTNLLRGIVANPDQRIHAIDFLSQDERVQMLHDWNNTQVTYDVERTALALVEEWAERTPEAVAVVWQGQRLTYGMLERRADQLARALQAAGVGAEARVGICVERSLDMIVCVLAVWKARAAYVPLDPGYPPERLAFMVRDSNPQVILTQRSLCAALPPAAFLLCLDDDQDRIARQAADRPQDRIAAQTLAYIVYTSGSTDLPKGVMVEHRSLASVYAAWRDAYGIRPGMRHLQMASFSFDVFAGDLVRALCSGGTLVICPRELLLEPPSLYRLIRREGPVCAEFVPAVIRELARYAKETNRPLDGFERLIVGSDLWYMDEYRQLKDACGAGARVINSYGVSEATIDSTYFEAGGAVSPAAGKAVPIGRPFANTQLFILDHHLQPVPIGAIGELYIGGAGLARGYLNRPDLTAERFVPNPFLKIEDRGWKIEDSNLAAQGKLSSILYPLSSTRLYRTGDLARYLSDGTAEFLGRNDQQVKIRGFRIELDEIQAVLSQHPHVDEALVIARKDERSNTYLVAYIVPTAEDGGWKIEDGRAGASETPSSILHPPSSILSGLRAFLKQSLPDYMLPAAYVRLDAFPLTPNGKIDLRALPEPDLSARNLEHTLVSPRDATELQLVEIWEDLLGVAPIGTQDNFFDIGGHSLLAVHLMARIQRRFNQHLPLSVLFQGATIESLAGVLRRNTDSSVWSPLVPLQAKGDKLPLFCVPGAGGNVISFYNLARRIGSDRPIYGLQSRGIDGETAPHTSVEAMAADYVEAIQRVQPRGPYNLCGHSFGSWVAFEIAQQLRRQGQEVALLAILNTPTPMVMSDDPAYRTDLPMEPPDATTMMLTVVRTIERTFGADLGLSHEQLRTLSADEQITELTEQLKRVGILPSEAETKYVRGFVNVFKTNYEIAYVPKAWLPTRIVLFRATEQYAEDDAVPLSIRDDPAWGWNEFATTPVEVHFVPGAHEAMLMEPHVQAIAEQFRSYLP